MKNQRINKKSRITMSKRKMLLMILMMFVAPIIQAQNISISVKDAKLETVLNQIKNQTDINIVFNHEEVNKAPNVTVNLSNVTVEEALKEALKNSQLEFQKFKNSIIIKPIPKQKEPESLPQQIKTQTLRGRVIDRDSKIGLPAANVVVLNTSPVKGVTSDMDGYFKIEDLPVGRHSIEISYIGYEKAVLSEILLGSAKEVVVTVELSESLQGLDEVTVSVKKGETLNEMASMSGKSFSVEETKRYAASISDPARMAQIYAGVSTTDDASNEIVIRGNSPNWLQWRIEGVEIPSPNHFAEEGFTAGAVSILSTNMLGKSDFYTGAFSAEYGNALSGVFDLKFRNGNNEKREYSAQVGVLGVELAAEGPFKRGYRGSYLLNYRYSTFSILNNLGLEVSENTLPSYQDLSFKFNLPTEKLGTFTVWGLGGLSEADEDYWPDSTLNEDLDNGYIDYTKTGMFASGIGHTFFPDQKSYVKSVISYSGSLSSNNVSDMDSLGVMRNSYNDDFNKNAIRFNTFYNRKISSKLTLRAGVNFSHLQFDYFSELTDDDYNWEKGIVGKGSTNIYNAYMQGKYKFNDRITFSGGLHYTHFELSKDNRIEPRLALQFDLPANQKLGLAYGVHSKNENLPVYFVAFEDENGNSSYLNKSLELTQSIHYVLSYEKLLSEDWRLKAEAYFQDISNMPVANNPDKLLTPAISNAVGDDTLVNAGKGRNYGVEITVQKFFTKQYYLMFSTSLFDSKYKPIDGKWYNTRFNSNYIFNLVGGKEINWGNNKMISLNGKLLWSGGQRTFPVDLAESIASGETEYDLSKPYSIKMDDYFRLDLGIKLHFYKKRTEHIIALDVQNVTNRMNSWYKFYNSETEKLEDYYMAGIIPILSYRIEF